MHGLGADRAYLLVYIRFGEIETGFRVELRGLSGGCHGFESIPVHHKVFATNFQTVSTRILKAQSGLEMGRCCGFIYQAIFLIYLINSGQMCLANDCRIRDSWILISEIIGY